MRPDVVTFWYGPLDHLRRLCLKSQVAAGHKVTVYSFGPLAGLPDGIDNADAEAVVWRIPDAQLATRKFIEGDQFTLADIALGTYARRWFGVEGITKPALPHLERWFAQFAGRPGFQKCVALPMS